MTNKKTFSQFLVDQGLLTADQLVDLLIQQMAQMPSVAEIVRSQDLLSAGQLIEVFSCQMNEGCDFVSACQVRSLWTPDVVAGVFEAQASSRIPIAELIRSSGLVTTEKLVSLLDHYLSEAASAGASPTPALPVVSAAPLAETPAQADSDNSVQFFHETYTLEVQSELMTLAHHWKHEDAVLSATLAERLHGLVGAARFAGHVEIENLFKEAETSVRGARDLPAVGDVLMQALRDDVMFNLERAWKVRESMNAFQEAA